jgi:hypothetical protein
MIPIPGSVIRVNFRPWRDWRVRWLPAFRITLRSVGIVGRRSFEDGDQEVYRRQKR